MTFDFRRPPMDILHMPAVHPGLSYVGDTPDWIIRPAKAAAVRLFAGSDDPALCARQHAMLVRQGRMMTQEVLEILSAPVVLENARFERGMVQLANRFWLNGASGSRVRTQFATANDERWRLERLNRAIRRTRAKGPARIGTHDAAEAAKLGVAIELKNGFNYYHFSTETLGSLAHFLNDGSTAPIRIHLPSGKVKSFIRRFVATIFPSLAERITFERAAGDYERVRSVYSHQHLLYAVRDPMIDTVLAGVDPRWPPVLRDPSRFKQAAKFTYDSSLRLLREAALAQLPRAGHSSTPRLIWMGRDEGQGARVRGIEGHEPLLEELTALGFEQVAFEHLSPLEQVAAMNGADIVIAPHGAGLANMIYARPGATVIEIGTRQTQLHRWGDFLKCAHVSRCNYDTVFADIEGVDADARVPAMSDGHRGIRVGRNATDRVIAIVGEVLGRAAAPLEAPQHRMTGTR
ncbi:glycosyltransferase family 61 protein [Paracoccus sp. NGMCC 1.201697]|uniref:Glycosyltransferase family 61 protein n=1 Tax=Paracoccus broussonetiae subsp. drimophilus TaxID=3373869 RepID=A0ABW7LKJ8_9RHOB